MRDRRDGHVPGDTPTSENSITSIPVLVVCIVDPSLATFPCPLSSSWPALEGYIRMGDGCPCHSVACDGCGHGHTVHLTRTLGCWLSVFIQLTSSMIVLPPVLSVLPPNFALFLLLFSRSVFGLLSALALPVSAYPIPYAPCSKRRGRSSTTVMC
jgi:hypothetical protein